MFRNLSFLLFSRSPGDPLGLWWTQCSIGKTESAKCFTEFVFGSRVALEMVFMNEYTCDLRFKEFLERMEAAILGHPDGTTLLFDEVEKAHPKLIDIFLSLLGEGQFTALSGERVSVSKFYIVLTSNLGSADLARMENAPVAMLERVAMDAASRSLRPELFARITERIVFRPLGLEAQKEIIDGLIAARKEKSVKMAQVCTKFVVVSV